MIELREQKVARIAQQLPPIEVTGDDRGDLLIIGWGGTEGAIAAAVQQARADGLAVSSIHLRHLNPFPPNLGEVLGRFERVLVAELNGGQLAMLLRARFLVPARSLTKLQGQPFKVSEIRARIDAVLSGKEDPTHG
jgi:2-oxoglutarate ferredoxin oxidoreductase subunit alpha